LKETPLFIIVVMLALMISACAPQSAPVVSFPPVPADYAGKTNPLGSEAAADGALNFVSYCEACHGATGLGDGPAGPALNPPPADLSAVASQVGDDYLFWRIREGKPGTAMVGWGSVLNEEQIWQVVAYVRSLK
jgi:mono/diheme cytochrome c family protein